MENIEVSSCPREPPHETCNDGETAQLRSVADCRQQRVALRYSISRKSPVHSKKQLSPLTAD
eukprot:6000942-Pyramimonas_sp.AAC.1